MNYFDPIAELMAKRGVTAYKLCKDLGISQTTVSNWKDGKKLPMEKAIEILKYLEASADELYGLDSAEMTPDERALIDVYRKCSNSGKTAVHEMAAFQASRAKSSTCGADQQLQA